MALGSQLDGVFLQAAATFISIFVFLISLESVHCSCSCNCSLFDAMRRSDDELRSIPAAAATSVVTILEQYVE